jgi:hypothetical protein
MTLEQQLTAAEIRMNNSLELSMRAQRIAGRDAEEYRRIKDLIDFQTDAAAESTLHYHTAGDVNG